MERRAAEYLDILSKKARNDLDLKRELAESYVRLGDAQGNGIDANLGKTKESIASLEKAVALSTEVYRARSSDPEARAALARAKLGLCHVLAQSDPARADQLRGEALELSSQALSPKLVEIAKLTLARAYFGKAERFAETGKTQEALAARNRSIELLGEMVAANPANEDALRLLGQSLKRRAVLELGPLHALDNARQDLEAAMRIDDRRIARNPNNAAARLDQALGQSYLAKLQQRQGDLAGADEMMDHAIATRVELLRADPSNVRNRTWLMSNYIGLAAIRRAEKRLPESMAAIAQGFAVGNQAAAPVTSSPDWIEYVGSLHLEAAQTRAQMGACKDAQRELDEAGRLNADVITARDTVAKHCGVAGIEIKKSKLKSQE